MNRLLAAIVLVGGFHAPARAAEAKTAIGYCNDDLEKAKAAGFDYAELAVRNFARMSDHDFAEFLRKHDEVGLKTPTALVFLPTEMKIVGPRVDEAAEMAYVRTAFARARKLGVELVVFGSGPSRMVPDGFSKEEAFRQLVAFSKRISPEARKYGIVLGVEAQRKEETNIINSVAEALTWVEAVDHPNFQLIVDFYHLAMEKEDPAIILKAAPHIKHIHFANPTGRVFPLTSDEYDYSGFFENLRKIGYRGRISIEARTDDLQAEAPKAIAFLRGAMAAGVPAPRTAAPFSPKSRPTVFLVGDSTVRNGNGDGANGQWGWGEPLAAYFDATKVNLLNRAIGGRSSRTFLTEGRWGQVLDALKPGDFVIVQFGHNDGGELFKGNRPRASLRGVGEETEEGIVEMTGKPETVHTYGFYLRKYVREAKAKGATAIVCSLVPRKIWKDGRIVRASEDYGKWAQEVARSEGAPFLDLNETIARRYDALGPDKVDALFADEHTHTNAAGAELNAASVVAGLKDIGDPALTALLSAKAKDLGEKARPANELTEVWQPVPPLVEAPAAGVPKDAIVLFDGTSLDAWEPVRAGEGLWKIEDGAMVVVPKPKPCDLRTKQTFGDVQLHLEWRTPSEAKGRGQDRGNSGVFFMGLYELQILDSWQNPTYVNGQAASVYKEHAPLVNASRPAGEWQVYDVVFVAPRFSAQGQLLAPARLTAFHNGVLVQHDVILTGPTPNGASFHEPKLPAYEPHAAKLPLLLQDHRHPVAFRNIWIRELRLPAPAGV